MKVSGKVMWITLTLLISGTDMPLLYSVNTLDPNTLGPYFILPNCNVFLVLLYVSNPYFNSNVLTSGILHTQVSAPSSAEYNSRILSQQNKWFSLYYTF